MAVAVGRRWETLALGNLAEFRNGINYNKNNFGRGIKVINVKDFQDYSIASLENLDEVNLSGVIKEKDLLRAGDIIFVRSNGNRELIGRSLFIKNIQESVTHSAFTIKLRFTSNQVIPRFYAYLFRSSLMRQTFSAHGNGTNISNLNQGILSNLEVPLPPLPIQRKIAAILSAYDDLIENNTRRIEILEEMARSIYREWFVKFRFPGHEQVQMVDSELGLIPEGWEVVKIGDVAEVGRGSSPRPIADQKYFEGGTIPWIKIADATKSGKYLYETKQKVNEYGASFSRLLPKGSLIIAASGTLGYTQLLGVDGCIHDGWLYLINFNGIEKEYLYYLFREQQQFFYNAAYGAAIQNVNTMILREMKIILPPSQIQKYFKDIISNSDNLLDNLGRKNLNLRQTRDLLLPRLISGEIDVENLDINTGPIAA